VADHTGRRVTVLRLTALAACIAICGLFFGRTFDEFLVIMVLINLFTGAQGPLSEALMLSEMKGNLTQYGRLRLWGSVGFIVSVMAAGKWLDRRGILAMPWIALAMLAMAAIASLRMEETARAHPKVASGSTRLLLRRREVAAFFLSAFLMVGAHASLYVYYSLYLAQLGYSKSVIGMMWSLGVVAEIVFFFYQAPIFRRLGVRRLMLASLLVAVLRFLMIGYGAGSLALLTVAQILHAATFGAHHAASVATLQRWFSGPLQARGQALYISIAYGLGGTLGGLVMSVFWDRFGAHIVYLTAAVFALGGMAAASLSYHWLSQHHGESR
jgi:PPP family 3-phenylpropionic acid transporter